MVCTWRPLVEKFCILLWQARVGREIERYKREREEEMINGREKWRSSVISATGRQGLGMAVNSYFSTSHGKPGIVAALSSGVGLTRNLAFQDPGSPG
jgi:hypothetical protein